MKQFITNNTSFFNNDINYIVYAEKEYLTEAFKVVFNIYYIRKTKLDFK